MACITTMQRYEIKYLLGAREKEAVLQAMSPYMELDEYGRTTIRNVYFDTDSFRLIRRSLEKPAYKEKLRIRSYQPARPDDPVFVELKKKYQSVVYKRRVVLPEQEALQSFRENTPLPLQSQIADEIEYFRSYYSPLRPTAFLSYEREAFRMTDGSDFRVTFDENILCRNRDFPWVRRSTAFRCFRRLHPDGTQDPRAVCHYAHLGADPFPHLPDFIFQIRNCLSEVPVPICSRRLFP